MASDKLPMTMDDLRRALFGSAAERTAKIVAEFPKEHAVMMMEEIVHAVSLTLGELSGHNHTEEILRMHMLRQSQLSDYETGIRPRLAPSHPTATVYRFSDYEQRKATP